MPKQPTEPTRHRTIESMTTGGANSTSKPTGRRERQACRWPVVVLCLAIVAIFPVFAEACAPRVEMLDDGVRIDGAPGIERVRMEIAYRLASFAGEADAARATRYQVVATTVPADGYVRYRPAMAAELISATVLRASGPACD